MYESIHLVLANLNNPKYNIDKELKKFLRLFLEKDIEKLESEYKGDERYMIALRTVEDLTTDERFIGYYDYEEERKRELEEEKYFAREEGLEEGKKENAIETAKKMLELPNITLEQIADCTSLTIEEVNLLKEEKNL